MAAKREKPISGAALTALFLVTILIVAPSSIPASDETIEPGSWVYPALRTLELAGLIRVEPDIPMTRGAIAAYVRLAESVVAGGVVDLTPRQEFLLSRLEKEFTAPGTESGIREDSPLWIMREEDRFLSLDLTAGPILQKRADRKKGELDGLLIPWIGDHDGNDIQA